MFNRRQFASTSLAAAASLTTLGQIAQAEEKSMTFEITKPDADWKSQLTPEAYRVLRKHGTERAGTSPLDKTYAPGTYLCAGCDLPLFASDTKYDSGTGWPSFYQPLDNAIGTSVDKSWFAVRTEVHCRRCGGHLGHVFEDGPQPTGLRYCMNGVALKFVPKAGS
jgi:peptide-methionine (R)-S-oxide reductase